jgi:hypothetical protein
MGKRFGWAIIVGVFVGGAVGLGGGAALATSAAPTFSIKPGGAFSIKASGNATAPGVVLFDGTTGKTIGCTLSKGSGKFKSGKGLPGSRIGTISTLSFTGCAGQAMTFLLTPTHFPWTVNATSYASGVTQGSLTGIHLNLTGACTAAIDGTSATADNGKISYSYTNSSRWLDAGKSSLHFYNVHGCGGSINSGDAAGFGVTYTVSPTQTITSP